jgi:hypothetical protein
MIGFAVGAIFGICVVIAIDGYMAILAQKREREKVNEELDRFFKDK